MNNHYKKEELKTKIAKFIANKLSNKVPKKYKKDTKLTKKINDISDISRDNIKIVSKYIPNVKN